jgi:hypothetical protein
MFIYYCCSFYTGVLYCSFSVLNVFSIKKIFCVSDMTAGTGYCLLGLIFLIFLLGIGRAFLVLSFGAFALIAFYRMMSVRLLGLGYFLSLAF